MSPLKRTCRELPEPPSFATLLQTELGEDDAVAWAASAAANDSLKLAGNLESCGSFLKFDSLGKVESGSLPAFVTVGGSEAAAAQMGHTAGYAAAGDGCVGGGGGEDGEGGDAAGDGCDEADEEARMLQAVLAQADGEDGDGCLLDDVDTEMGDAAAGEEAAAVQNGVAAAAAADCRGGGVAEVQQLAGEVAAAAAGGEM
jgi:hypothetical protein